MSKSTELRASWRDWVMTNLKRGCTHDSIIRAMVEKDFDPQFAATVVCALAAVIGPVNDQSMRDQASLSIHPQTQKLQRAIAQNSADELSRLPASNLLTACDCRVSVLVRLTKPEVIVLADLLSDDECAELIRRSEAKLARSTTIDPQTGKEILIENRSSFGTFFQLNEDDFVATIDRRLSELLNWPVDHSEGLQILRYQVGGEYRPHFDYFPPDDPGSRSHILNGGQRIGTLVAYLNDVEDGGETIFPEIGLSVVPRRGHAVYFGYCNSHNQVDPLTLHGGAPVRSGVKWIATKWLRQHRRV